MYLVQLFIPTADQNGETFPQQYFADLKDEFTDLFGGVTIYARSPAKGLWKPAPDSVETDNMVIYEVLVRQMDSSYWTSLKSRLEETFRQQQILIRYFNVTIVE